MKDKLDSGFYNKTLEMLNAKAIGKLDQYLGLTRANSIDIESLPSSITSEFYNVIIITPRLYENGVFLYSETNALKNQLEQELYEQYGAQKVTKGEKDNILAWLERLILVPVVHKTL